jgi:hypothetical protein
VAVGVVGMLGVTSVVSVSVSVAGLAVASSIGVGEDFCRDTGKIRKEWREKEWSWLHCQGEDTRRRRALFGPTHSLPKFGLCLHRRGHDDYFTSGRWAGFFLALVRIGHIGTKSIDLR